MQGVGLRVSSALFLLGGQRAIWPLGLLFFRLESI